MYQDLFEMAALDCKVEKKFQKLLDIVRGYCRPSCLQHSGAKFLHVLGRDPVHLLCSHDRENLVTRNPFRLPAMLRAVSGSMNMKPGFDDFTQNRDEAISALAVEQLTALALQRSSSCWQVLGPGSAVEPFAAHFQRDREKCQKSPTFNSPGCLLAKYPPQDAEAGQIIGRSKKGTIKLQLQWDCNESRTAKASQSQWQPPPKR